jgi:predicted lipoprotein with Yx(FWY)xxD motif
MHDSISAAGARSGSLRLVAAAAVTALAAVATLAVAVGGSHAAPAARKAVVATARNAELGATILVDRRGRTLYHLSVEGKGRFVCTTAFCLSLWRPLLVPRGTTPAGIRGLSTVRRPDGRRQVVYRGAPLYTFTQDRKRGDISGNGFRDVGVWRVATVSGASSSGSTGGGYRYGS